MGSANIYTGSDAGGATEADTIRIGTPAAGMGRCFIAGIRDVDPAGGGEELVVINANGQRGSVSLALLTAAASTIQELKSTVAKQEATAAAREKEIKALTARLEEQAAQIQKVSAQLEVSTPAPRIVANK